MKRVFEKADKVGVIINPDPDSMASAFAFHSIIKKWVASCEILHLTETRRHDNRTMLRLLKLKYKPFRQVDISRFTKLVMIDSQPAHNPLSKNLNFHVIIDHHPDVLEHDVQFKDIRPEYGAVATMMIEYLISAKVPITPRIATALYYAIMTDTDAFRRISTHKDVDMVAHLLPKLEIGTLRLIESSEIPRSYLKYIVKALQEVNFSKNLAYVHVGELERDEYCAIIADFLLRIKGIHWSAVSATVQKNIVVVLRSWRETKHVGKIAKRAFSCFGRAGGHHSAARAEIPVKCLPEEYLPAMDLSIRKFIIDRILFHHKKHIEDEKNKLPILCDNKPPQPCDEQIASQPEMRAPRHI